MNDITLICIIGASGAGKTTIAEEMAKFGLPTICSYTTRPKREGEHSGKEHIFLNDAMAVKYLTCYSPLAYTQFGGYHYFALFDQLYLAGDGKRVLSYVIDEAGLLDLIANIDERNDRLRYVYHIEAPKIKVLPVVLTRRDIGDDIDAQRRQRDAERIDLNPEIVKLRIENDAADVDALRAWCKDFAEAIRAYLTIQPADVMSSCPEGRCIYTSQTGVANIIAAMNDAFHNS